MPHRERPAALPAAGLSMPARRRGALVAVVGLAAFGLMAATGVAHARRPALLTPDSPSTIVERLPSGYPTPAPGDGADVGSAFLAQAEALQAASARTGDARLSTRADALLARLPVQGSVAVLKARAYGAQHRHDFKQAARLLDAAVRADPRDAGARLARAQLHLVQGRIRGARADCAALSIGVDADAGQACTIAFMLRRGDLARAAASADDWLSRPSADPALRGYVLSMRAEIASRAGEPRAADLFEALRRADPGDVRIIAPYARHLLGNGRAARATALLADAPDTDGIALLRALALYRSGDPRASAAAEALAARYATAHAVGVQPELRDEAEFLLTFRRQPAAALALAQRNFREQRDFEDVDLLRRAARAARQPGALSLLQAWEREEDFSSPDLPARTAPGPG